MAKLSAKKRKSLPKSDFGMPGEGKYPMPDESHAANAKARATQQVKKGNLSTAAKAKIDAKADKVLAKKGSMSQNQASKTASRIKSKLSSKSKKKTQLGFE